MPMYDLYCKGCGHEEKDVLAASDKQIMCPECNEEHLTHMMSPISFKMKSSALVKHLNKYGSESASVPKQTDDNGVKIYGKEKGT
jgi:putative FmdB family regulatory protein